MTSLNVHDVLTIETEEKTVNGVTWNEIVLRQTNGDKVMIVAFMEKAKEDQENDS